MSGPFTPDPSAQDLDTLTRTLWGECRGEPADGQVAVAYVVRTRAQLAQQGICRALFGDGTIADACRMPEQFSCWNPSPYADEVAALSPNDPNYQRLLTVSKVVLGGHVLNPAEGATHYEVTGSGAYWADGKTPIAIIGHHSFYKLS